MCANEKKNEIIKAKSSFCHLDLVHHEFSALVAIVAIFNLIYRLSGKKQLNAVSRVTKKMNIFDIILTF